MHHSIVAKGSPLNKALSVVMALMLAITLASFPSAYASDNASDAADASASSESAVAQETTEGEGLIAPAPQDANAEKPATELGSPSNDDEAASQIDKEQEEAAETPKEVKAPLAPEQSEVAPSTSAASAAAQPAAPAATASATRTVTDAATGIQLDNTANNAATAVALPQATLRVRANEQIDAYDSAAAPFAQTLGQSEQQTQPSAFDLYDIQLVANGAPIALASEDAATVTLPAASDATVYGTRDGQPVKLNATYANDKATAKLSELGYVAVENPASVEPACCLPQHRMGKGKAGKVPHRPLIPPTPTRWPTCGRARPT